MINPGKMRNEIAFKVFDGNDQWIDLKDDEGRIVTARACIEAIRSAVLYLAVCGGNAEQVYIVTLRYNPFIAALVPQTSKLICDGFEYELISVPEDVGFKHRSLTFKARRLIH